MSDTLDKIMLETCRAICRLGPRFNIMWRLCEIVDDFGPEELKSIIGSYGDTLSDEQVLRYLKDWNESGKVIQERQ